MIQHGTIERPASTVLEAETDVDNIEVLEKDDDLSRLMKMFPRMKIPTKKVKMKSKMKLMAQVQIVYQIASRVLC